MYLSCSICGLILTIFNKSFLSFIFPFLGQMMDRTQPHFDSRKGIQKKCGILRKHELFSHNETSPNKQNAHNLIFQKMGLCATSAEAVRKTVTTQSSQFLPPGLQKKFSYCKEPFWRVYDIPKNGYSKKPAQCSLPFRCKPNRTFYDYGLPMLTLE